MPALLEEMDGDCISDLMHSFPTGPNDQVHDGFIKLKLVHGNGYSLIIPDILIMISNKPIWFQPKYFSPPSLSFIDEAGYGQFNIVLDRDVDLLIGITRDRLVKSYGDGSFLYRCRIKSAGRFRNRAAGTCTVGSDYTIWLDLFHHTSASAASAIRSSKHFRGSRWNIQGTKELRNVEYVYFTSMPAITSREDLKRIAMSSDGSLELLPTNGTPPRDLVRLEVYRADTLSRRHTVRMRVPADAIAGQHIWRHDPWKAATYYEVSHTAIFRVGLEPGTVLPFLNRAIDLRNASLKRFEYVVLGNANTRDGLIAPYDEEDTRELFKIENCKPDGDLFGFWQNNANRDHYSNRDILLQDFAMGP